MDHQHVRNHSPGLYVQAGDFEFRGDLKCKAAIQAVGAEVGVYRGCFAAVWAVHNSLFPGISACRSRYFAVMPPSMISSLPVFQVASWDARYSAQ